MASADVRTDTFDQVRGVVHSAVLSALRAGCRFRRR